MIFTVKDLSSKYNVTENTIRKAIKLGELVAVKPGGNKTGYRIDEDDAKSWWDSKKK